MDENIAREILEELFSSLENLETRSAGLLQFVKDKGLASEQDLAPYFEQAGNASGVRWRAARVRIDHLLASAFKAEEREAKQQSPEPKDKNEKSTRNAETSSLKEGQEGSVDNSQRQKDAARAKLEARDATPTAGKTPDRQHDRHATKTERNNEIEKETAKEKQNVRDDGTRHNAGQNAA